MPASTGIAARSTGARSSGKFRGDRSKPEPKIIFQKFFKSVGPRTYAAQVKEVSNGNQLLVLTEGKRDEATNEIRKTRVFVYAEDFREYFRMLHEVAEFLRANPLSDEVKKKRDKYWNKQNAQGAGKTART
jgi:hypothetical protein